MMKKTLLSISCAALLTCGASSVFAEPDWAVSGNVALTSDYVFRGLTQTDGDAAIQGGFDVNHSSGFFAGVWASNVDAALYSDSEMELDTYLGWTGKIVVPEVTLKALRYNYPGTTFNDNNTNEYSIYLAHDFGPAAVSGGLNYSDDYYGLGDTIYWDLGVDVPVGPVSLGFHYGATDIDDDSRDLDYQDYKIGVSGELVGLGLDLSFYGTSDAENISGVSTCSRHECDDRVVFTMSKSF
jgi:uncharacterized protein (TIGR02001 family)